MNKQEENRKRILIILKDNLNGLTMSKIKNILNLPLDAVRVAIAQLEIINKVTVQVVGASKLIKLKETNNE